MTPSPNVAEVAERLRAMASDLHEARMRLSPHLPDYASDVLAAADLLIDFDRRLREMEDDWLHCCAAEHAALARLAEVEQERDELRKALLGLADFAKANPGRVLVDAYGFYALQDALDALDSAPPARKEGGE